MFQYLEDIATADVAFEARGSTLEELFVQCALATFEAMLDTKKVRGKIEKMIELENEDPEELLYDWLTEIISLKDSESLALGAFEVKLEKNRTNRLHAKVRGEKINPERHELRSDVKAVTYHLFKLRRDKGGWIATVVLDI